MRTLKRVRRALPFIASACLASAHAQEPGAEASAHSKWKVSIGPGVMVTPVYPGSQRLELIPLPSLDISYDDRIFSQGLDVLGVNALKGDAYHVGAAVTFDFVSRKESDDARLRGLGNVHSGPKLKLFADYSVSLLTGSVALYQDIGGTGQGMQISTDLAANLPLTERLLVSVGPGFTWANSVYARTLFGVSPQQSAASGMPQFDATSGIRDVHLNAYASYDFTKHWTASLLVTTGWLQNFAAHSPITERRTELNAFAAVNYRF
ncbi:outer membrane scaffolding protein for murein synthesis (MipA/OmpV family) [Paraburkholderia sp. BL8N3]|nr:MipA/OmpV family protein [Paraburkholderia sp. BL8N3]TCK42062.1 outer membrane scaffolding protein for murein synthesis (MipA/OmpV family) [Paraburkholderia sp. BL8N3]